MVEKLRLSDFCDIFTGKKDVNQASEKGEYKFFSCAPKPIYSNEYIYDGNAIIIAGNGSYTGRVSYYSGKFDLYQRTYACVLNTQKMHLKYVYYFMKNFFEPKFLGGTRGSSIPYIVKGDLENFEINCFDLTVQKKIASVLSALDDKIELNNKINENLEQQAQALFKSWFIDFEPFGGVMPDDWKVGKLGNFIEIKRGGSPRPIQNYLVSNGLNWLKISDATAENSPFILNIKEHIKIEGLSKTVRLEKGALVLSNSATPGIPKFLCIDTCIHDGWLYFPKSLFSNEYLFLLFSNIRNSLISLGNGSIFTNLKTDILRNFETILPSEKVLKKFDNIVISLFLLIKKNREEIEKLSTLRDTLLPKLMSGEIDVDKVQIDEVSA